MIVNISFESNKIKSGSLSKKQAPIVCEPLMVHTHNTRNLKIKGVREERRIILFSTFRYERSTKLSTLRVLFIVYVA